MVWVLADLVRGLIQLKQVSGKIGQDSDPYLLLSIKQKKIYNNKMAKKSHKQRYTLQQCKSFSLLMNGHANKYERQQRSTIFSVTR